MNEKVIIIGSESMTGKLAALMMMSAAFAPQIFASPVSRHRAEKSETISPSGRRFIREAAERQERRNKKRLAASKGWK